MRLALLGPLAVLPALQRRAIGTALVHEALLQLAAAEVTRSFVLGDPAYYGRFGFAPEREIAPPLPVPPAWRSAWQSLSLPGAGAVPPGTLSVPSPWHDPSLWGA
jgi:putative acetyltransferase